MKSVTKIIPVILCGGFGTRLWPLSREKSPKQFHPIINDTTLLHDTMQRAVECTGVNPADIMTVTTDSIKKETVHQMADFNPDSIQHLLSEPTGRNTAAAIAYAALYAQKHFGLNTQLWILPADHYIKDDKALADALQQASGAAEEGYITTFGMTPTRPDIGYGYIQSGGVLNGFDNAQSIKQFVEKPNLETAKQYLDDGTYLWNSGMFLASVQTLLDNFIEYCPEVLAPMHKAFKENERISFENYTKIPALPFDVAIMEKTEKAAVIPCNIGWSDVGSWESVWETKDKDKNGNVCQGRVAAVDTTDSYIHSNSLLIATMGLKDIVIVENGDSVLIADKKNNASMKTLVETLKKMDGTETMFPPMENRPWGSFKVLSESDGYKVKEIIVKPGGKLSLQMHHHRCEFWTVISGEAIVTINDEDRILGPQESAFIPLTASHRLENKGEDNLIMVEVQCGDYLGEDDIVRFDDIYGRTEEAA